MKFWSVVRRPLSVVALLLLGACAARAQSQLAIELPLGPYWRAGKYVPVRLVATVERGDRWVGVASNGVVKFPSGEIGGLGASRTSVMVTDGKLDAVVPWLVMDARAKRPRLFVERTGEAVEGPELVRLGDSERLVGFATAVDEGVARRLVGEGAKMIAVPLDPVRPIRGHAVAWELLDAIVLDGSSYARLEEGQVSALLSCGVAVVVRGDRAPGGGWPWARDGDCWVLRYSPAGPTTAGFHPDAFEPVADWRGGWPWAFRRRLLLMGVAVCIVLVGLALWRPRWVAVWMVAAVVVASGAMGFWWRGRLPIRQAGGEIVVVGDRLTQTDGWTYQASDREVLATLRWTEVSRPIFASRGGMDDVWLTLNCDTGGRPKEFAARLPAGRRLAFHSRSVVGMVRPRTMDAAMDSPLKALVDKGLYPGDVIGELPPPPNPLKSANVEMEQWGAVVVVKRNDER